jgi:colanic acid biosynthesis glycosyl transferase WcaI
LSNSAPAPLRVILINRYFYPDLSATSEMVSGLAFGLARRKVRVIVVASRLRYENRARGLYPSRESINDVQIHRVWTSSLGRSFALGRSIDYLSFFFAAGWQLWKLARRRDLIVAKTDPPLLSVMAAPIAKLRGAKLVNWLQDIFPEVAEALHLGGRPGSVAFSMMHPFRNWSLRMADMNVVVGQTMATRLLGLGVGPKGIRVIHNWSDEALVFPIASAQNAIRQSWAPQARFLVVYAGNLGRAHDIDTILEAMTMLNERALKSLTNDIARQILFIFVGGGAQRARLEREVLRRRLANVRLHPYQPRERLAETLSVADLHLVSLNPKLEGLVVPSKFYGIAAAGRPTLFIGAPDGEIARLIDEARCGFTVSSGDGEAVVDRILQLAETPELCAELGARARTAFEQHWTKDRAIEQWQQVLCEAASLARDRRVQSEPRSEPLPTRKSQ